MQRLRAHCPVLWVNSIGMRRPSKSNTDLVARRYLRKAMSLVRGLRQPLPGLHVFTPLFIPDYSPKGIERNGALVAAQVRLLLAYLRIKRPAVWTTVPTAAPVAARLNATMHIFNRSDEFSAFPECDATVIRPLEERLLATADLVYFVNRELLGRERASCRRAAFLGHGVDFEVFAEAGLARGRDLPDDLRSLPRPLIGFYGAFDGYTIDLDLLIAVARAFPKATLLLIGPLAMDISRLLAEPNVRHLGPKPYAEIPRYGAAFDVALMPWLQNEWIRKCNPIKLKEYLALGVPIVSTPFPELEPYAGSVSVASDPASFVKAIVQRLERGWDTGESARQRALVAKDGWSTLADRVWQDMTEPRSGA
jgi:glycosyltransferase involved in cell wall biosynthesis